eukprot:7376703-Prymnesium_polylepis.1
MDCFTFSSLAYAASRSSTSSSTSELLGRTSSPVRRRDCAAARSSDDKVGSSTLCSPSPSCVSVASAGSGVAFGRRSGTRPRASAQPMERMQLEAVIRNGYRSFVSYIGPSSAGEVARANAPLVVTMAIHAPIRSGGASSEIMAAGAGCSSGAPRKDT